MYSHERGEDDDRVMLQLSTLVYTVATRRIQHFAPETRRNLSCERITQEHAARHEYCLFGDREELKKEIGEELLSQIEKQNNNAAKVEVKFTLEPTCHQVSNLFASLRANCSSVFWPLRLLVLLSILFC